MYHHVAPLSGRESLLPYVVSPQVFCRQLDVIVASRLPVVTMAELMRRQEERSLTGRRCVVLTFDDCSRELLDYAVPELERRNLRASFYAVASRFGGQNDWDDHRGGGRVQLMLEDELKALVRMGHEVGSHGVHHRRLDQCSREDVVTELTHSKRRIEEVTGLPVETLAYPFGAIPLSHGQLCREAGYTAACSIFSAARTVLSDRFAIRRILIHEADIGWRMRFKLSRLYLELRRVRDRSLIERAEFRPELSEGPAKK